ncbi:recombinase RecT [Brucella anthropi]|uniref:Recombinase RecT n=1 Tax=Brucella anthropi TaxID=529 RepID=A0A6I0DTC4_BRUAN|nr:recombinase RecT [Brucella anthropi]KAB2798941.1 recombinase RecT [Brucella anthropi]
MNQIAPRETSINSVTVASGANGSSIAPQNLGEVVRFAEVMCKADIALPKHLRGNAGACMAVAMQALEWQMSPFAVASKSYSVNGTIAYEAQLIAAVVNTRSGIKGRLKYAFKGSGSDMTCTVTGMLDGEECEYTSPTIGTIPTKNSPLWKSDPQQQLGYFSARSWARRHCPEVLLGVYDRDEAESFQGPDNAKDVTPVPSVMQRLQQRQSETQSGEGFSKDFVTSETDTLASGQNNEEQDTPAEVASSGSVEGGERSVLSDPTLINSDEEVAPFDNQPEQTESKPASVELTVAEREGLKEYINQCRNSVGPDPSVIVSVAKGYADMFTSDLAKAKARKITERFIAVCKEEETGIKAVQYSCSIIGADPAELDEVE